MRFTKTILLKDIHSFKQKLLQWSKHFNDVVWLDSNDYDQKYAEFSAVLAVGAHKRIKMGHKGAFDALKMFQTQTSDWLFGYLSYDLKNDIEDMESNNFDGLHFPELYIFQPKKLFKIKGNRLTISYLENYSDTMETDIDTIQNISTNDHKHQNNTRIKLRIHKDAYFMKVGQMLHHIHRGDIYEANFCQEFYAEDTLIDPLETYRNLNDISRPPFATFLRVDDHYLLSASPERYIKKTGNTIISQPIKGTAKRSADPAEDEKLKKQLSEDQKERSENVMIVDLVRNDLSRTAVKGSVEVKELCKVYTFEQVHQMISTVTSRIDDGVHPVDVIRTTFPMGSMTGAPKISAMKIIESLEETKRGLYSGAVGYFMPNGDFDFNVVIRSILYNADQNYVSYSVGGAITAESDPLREYEECLVKAKAMREVLEN